MKKVAILLALVMVLMIACVGCGSFYVLCLISVILLFAALICS